MDETKVTYTEVELAEITLHNHYALKAVRIVYQGIFETIAELINPELAKALKTKIPELVKKTFDELIKDDPKITAAIQDDLLQSLKDDLDL